MKLQVDLKVRHFDQRRINCKMVMPQHMQIKNSYILKSCSPINNLFYLLGFWFSRQNKGYLRKSCSENLQRTAFQSSHNCTVSIKQRPTSKNANESRNSFPFLQNILHKWHLQNQPPCDSNIITSKSWRFDALLNY